MWSYLQTLRMRSQRREGKDHAVEAEDERSEERGPGPGPDIGSTKRIGDVTPVIETVTEGGGGDTIIVAAPRAMMTCSGGEETVTLIVTDLRLSYRRLFSQPLTR